MGEFASKGVAGSGLGLGIAGTALGLLNANGNGGGLLGGLLGGGCQNAQLGQALNALAEKDAKIAELTAMRYSDNQDAAVYKQTLADNKTLRDEMYAYITPIAQESAANRERVAVLEAQQKCEAEKAQLREQIITQKIDRVASDAPAVSATFRLKSVPSRLVSTPSRRRSCRLARSARSRCPVTTSGRLPKARLR